MKNNTVILISENNLYHGAINLIAQVFSDKRLKVGLDDVMIMKNGKASRDIRKFSANPLEFTNANAISGDSMTRMGRLPAQGKAQFVKISPNNYAIEYVYEPSNLKGELAVDAYFLGYNGANQSAKTPAYVDIPINAVDNSFLFTGSLTGCSIVVTKLNDTTYRVYHDGRVNSSILYDNVVMAFDYRDYQVSGADEGLAMAYMRFKNEKWQLVLQRQEYKVIKGIPTPVLRETESSISALYADTQWNENHQQIFSNYRKNTHLKLLQLASYFEINTENIHDGIYIDGEFSLRHSAIFPWVNLVNQINQHYEREIEEINNTIEKFEQELNKLNAKVIKNEKDKIRIDELNQSIEGKRNVVEYNRSINLSLLTEAVSVEKSWLWQQIKNKQGFDAVVQTNEEQVGAGISILSVNKRYEQAVKEHIRIKNNQFNQGTEQYKEIDIQGFNEDMTAQEMKLLYLDNELNPKERGALYQYIKEKDAAEHVTKVLSLSNKINELFNKKGSINSQLAPQDFYLPLMGDKSGGRCYPLVRAMAVALEKKGLKGANTLFSKMFLAAGSPENVSSVLLKNSLANLHSNIDAIQASHSLGQLNLTEIKSILIEGDGSKMYAMNSSVHSMLIGKTVHEGIINYYFYDPNFGLFTFDNSDNLFSALNKFMINEKMASVYLALDVTSKTSFKLIDINVEQMGNVPIGAGLTVTDLSNENELNEVISRRKTINDFIENKNNITEDLQVKSSLDILKAEQWGERIKDSVNQLTMKNELDNEWLPNFYNVETTEEGKYRIEFIHQDDELKMRWLETEDKTFIDFKEYFDKNMRVFKNTHVFENGKLQRGENISDVDHVDGLNMGMAFHALIQWVANRNRQELSDGGSSNLETALKIHSYVSYAMMAHGAVNDTAKVAKLVHTLWKQSAGIERATMESFSSSLMRTAGEGVGALFQGGMVGLDIYELANAQNDEQKSIFGTQLAFDSAALALGAVEYGTALAGAEGLVGIAGPLTVPVVGIGIGVIELVKINALHAQEAAQVGSYFFHLQNGYKNADLVYDQKKKLLQPTEHVVFKSIDFRTGKLELGSQYIYRGKKGIRWSLGYHTLSDFGDTPGYDPNKQDAINVREAVGITTAMKDFNVTQSEPIVLPIVPESYISYKYGSLAFSTSRQDAGFSILRQMEEDYKFYFDFFHSGLHKIIIKLEFEYKYTTMRIHLDKKDRHFIVPEIPNVWKNKLLHILNGNGGEYRININYGATVRLQDSVKNGELSKWIIDTSFIDFKNAYVYENRVNINGVDIYTEQLNKSAQVLIVNKKHELYKVDLVNKNLSMVSTDANQWANGMTAQQYFNNMESKKLLKNNFVTVHNYKHNNNNFGRAYYDVKNKRMLFTNNYKRRFHSSILAAFDDRYAYFHTKDGELAWSVSIESGRVNGTFDFTILNINGKPFKITNVWKENDNIFIKTSVLVDDANIISLFKIDGPILDLIEFSNNRYLLDELANTVPENLHHKFEVFDFFIKYNKNKKLSFSKSFNADFIYTGDIMMIDGKDSDGINRRYWLRRDYNVYTATALITLIKPNLEKSYDPQGYMEHPDDLMLITSLFDEHGSEIFFFFSKKKDRIYRQEGLGQSRLDDDHPTAKILKNIRHITNIVVQDGKLLVTKNSGVIVEIDINGNDRIAALNEKWLKDVSDNSFWWSRINPYYKDLEHPIALLGLRDLNNKMIPAWYFKENTIIAKSLTSSNNLHFVGFSQDNQGAFILDTKTGKLHYQKSVQYVDLSHAFKFPPNITSAASLPETITIYPDLKFKNVKLVEGGILLTTEDNKIIYHPVSNEHEIRNRQKLSSSLIIKGTKNDDILNVNKIDDVKHLTLSGGEGCDTYKFSYTEWQGYDTIIIDNYAKDKAMDEIILPFEFYTKDVFLERKDNDIILSDVKNKTLLIIREVYGAQADNYRHFKIKYGDDFFSLEMETIIDALKEKAFSVSLAWMELEQVLSNISRIQPKSLNLLSEKMSQIKEDRLSNGVINYTGDDFSKSATKQIVPNSHRV